MRKLETEITLEKNIDAEGFKKLCASRGLKVSTQDGLQPAPPIDGIAGTKTTIARMLRDCFYVVEGVEIKVMGYTEAIEYWRKRLK